MQKLVTITASLEELETALDRAECYGAEVVARKGYTYTIALNCSCEELEAWADGLEAEGVEVETC